MDEIKANLRGLKNKPGSTRPADITNFVRKRPNYENSVVMTYALTHKVSHAPFVESNQIYTMLETLLFPAEAAAPIVYLQLMI